MIRKCFTVNPNRKKEEIDDFSKVLKNGTYVGCEFFYPYNKTEEEKLCYLNSIKEYLKYDIEFVCHLPYGKLNNLATYDNIEEVLHRLKDAIDFASNMPVTKLTLHPGELDGTLTKEEAIKVASKHIKELCIYAKKYNMIFMLENLGGKHELMKTPEEYIELKTLIDEDNVKFIFDVAHYHSSYADKIYNKSIVNVIKTLKDDLYHLHISDNDGTRDSHSKIGEGNIDFKEYFNCLREIEYQGLLSSEVLFNTSEELMATSDKIDTYQ